MIVANQQFAIHLKMIRNLTGFTSGRYAFRISLKQVNSQKNYAGLPFNLIQKQLAKQQNRSQLNEEFYMTRHFFLKGGVNVDIDQICIFKLNNPLFSDGDGMYNVRLTCQMIHIQQTRNRVIGDCNLKITGYSIHEYFQIDFYDCAPCQVVGTIHSCIYKFQFYGEQAAIDMATYSKRYNNFKLDDIIDYLKTESSSGLQIISQNYKSITGKEMQFQNSINFKKQQAIQQQAAVMKPAEKQIKIVAKTRSRRNMFTNQTQITEGDQEINVIKDVPEQKKKRRKIFNSQSLQVKNQKITSFELEIHQTFQKIYQLWRDILVNLFSQSANKFMHSKCVQFRKKLGEKIGQSMVRFKGSLDVDLYGNQEQMRNKLAHQLRNQEKSFFKDFKSMVGCMFPVIDQAFFSSQRPIFFQQNAIPQNTPKLDPPKQILIILVHGLGACRLDMQKIKVQLRRYYDYKIKVYISTSNQARTEGNIDNMGQRLATQVDYQLSKSPEILKVSFLGHSMGGVIIRSALPRLQKYKDKFHSFMTLSSPHLGYAYSNSKLVDAGLWLINTMKKCTSIQQLTMQDNEEITQTFLYKLSKQPGMSWFKKIILLGSHQDLYVPYYSARMQKNEEIILDVRNNVKRGMVYCDMVDSILLGFKGEIIRLNINFCIAQQNIDNLIGRAAHISFITNVQMIRTFVIAGPHYFF